MRLSWLDVEKVIIFLILFWVRVYIVVNNVVIVFRYNMIDWVNLLFFVSG